ncbi:MAG: hypothetical protein MZV64_69885 [Ignavibacteriales bacterium]|nr:hypothetical protein [Ignavibacteriales bacterium]
MNTFVCFRYLLQELKLNRVKLSDEHTEYQWVDKITAQKLLAWEGQTKSGSNN